MTTTASAAALFTNNYANCKALVDTREPKMSEELRQIVAGQLEDLLNLMADDEEREDEEDVVVPMFLAKRAEFRVASTVRQTARAVALTVQNSLGDLI